MKDLADFPPDWPELELLPLALSNVPVPDNRNYVSFAIAEVAPLSRGNVTINSTEMVDQPLISLNWLLSRTDQEVVIAGFKVARDIAKESNITVGEEFAPGPSVQTDDQILEAIKNFAAPIYHAVGTCRRNSSVRYTNFD